MGKALLQLEIQPTVLAANPRTRPHWNQSALAKPNYQGNPHNLKNSLN